MTASVWEDLAPELERWIGWGAILLIRAYQSFLSPLLGEHCRFYPSCSQYAIDAIQKYGVVSGAMRAVKRLLRCHPFHPGGVDPA